MRTNHGKHPLQRLCPPGMRRQTSLQHLSWASRDTSKVDSCLGEMVAGLRPHRVASDREESHGYLPSLCSGGSNVSIPATTNTVTSSFFHPPAAEVPAVVRVKVRRTR
jgi:hypothetical protein